MKKPTSYEAAWVPDDDPERPWDDAVDLAVPWILAQADELDVAPILVTNTQHAQHAGPDSLAAFAQRYNAVTPRGRRLGARGAALLYVPDERTFEVAASIARGSALCVVESDQTPMRGWAMEVRAVNLLTGAATPDERSDALRKDLDMLMFVGNNGWGDRYGKQRAHDILSRLRDTGELDIDVVLGCALAHHASARGYGHLRDIAERVAGR